MSITISIVLLTLCLLCYFASCGATAYYAHRSNLAALSAYMPGMIAIVVAAEILPRFSTEVQLIGFILMAWCGISLLIGTMLITMQKRINVYIIFPWSLGFTLSYPLIRWYAMYELRKLK